MINTYSSIFGWANYHSHSNFCDGRESLEMYIQAAIKEGMRILGVSSHAPVPFYTDWNMKSENLSDYLSLINTLKAKYAQDIKILSSLEVDYIPELAGPGHPFIQSLKLDYVVGSVHFAGKYPDGRPWSIDDSSEDFEKGINQIFGGNIQQAIEHYFYLQRAMLEQEPPDIIGHLDKIRLHNRNMFFFDEESPWYLQQVHDTMKLAAEKGVIVEINTKHNIRYGMSYPSKQHLKWMADNKIPVTLSSDAHQPGALVSGFKEIAKLLRNSGVNELWNYQDGVFVPKKYTENGILWN
jgi:histidinol-phosphatase (PHP family)